MDARVVKEPAIIQTQDARISISGALGVEDFHRLLAAIHDRINGRGYSEVVLDFSGCTATFAGPMLAVCAQVGLLRHSDAKVGLVLPEKENVRRLFVNTNWAYMIDHETYGVSQFKGTHPSPCNTVFFGI